MKMIHMAVPGHPEATLEGYILDCEIKLGQSVNRPAIVHQRGGQARSGVFHKLRGPTVCPPVLPAVFCDVFHAMKWGPEKQNQNSSYLAPQQAAQRKVTHLGSARLGPWALRG